MASLNQALLVAFMVHLWIICNGVCKLFDQSELFKIDSNMLMEFSNVKIMVKCINYLRFYFYNLNYDEFGFNFEGFMEFN